MNVQTKIKTATVNSEIFARVLLSRSFTYGKVREIKYSRNGEINCHLLMKVNHAIVANFNVANMSFKAIRENKILMKISEFSYSSICLFNPCSAEP